MNTAARRFFDREIGGKNFMTPERLDVQWTHDGEAFELSTGTDFDHRQMWGVSVLDGGQIDHDRSQLFHEGSIEQRRAAAYAYVDELKAGTA